VQDEWRTDCYWNVHGWGRGKKKNHVRKKREAGSRRTSARSQGLEERSKRKGEKREKESMCEKIRGIVGDNQKEGVKRFSIRRGFDEWGRDPEKKVSGGLRRKKGGIRKEKKKHKNN